MKKLLALSGLGSSVAFWAMTSTALPKIVLIVLVLALASLNPNPPDVGFAASSGTLAGLIVNFTIGFFNAGGVTNTELIVGL